MAIKIIQQKGNYRIIEGYGPCMNKRYELEKRYYYYDTNGHKVNAWQMIFHSRDLEDCEKALQKRLESPREKNTITPLTLTDLYVTMGSIW